MPSRYFSGDLNVEEEKILRVYQAETYRFLGAFLEKGRGSDEVISCQEIWASSLDGKKGIVAEGSPEFPGCSRFGRFVKSG